LASSLFKHKIVSACDCYINWSSLRLQKLRQIVSWGRLGPSGARLGDLLERLGRILGRLGLLLERSGGVLERLERVLERLGASGSRLPASGARLDWNYVSPGARGEPGSQLCCGPGGQSRKTIENLCRDRVPLDADTQLGAFGPGAD